MNVGLGLFTWPFLQSRNCMLPINLCPPDWLACNHSYPVKAPHPISPLFSAELPHGDPLYFQQNVLEWTLFFRLVGRPTFSLSKLWPPPPPGGGHSTFIWTGGGGCRWGSKTWPCLKPLGAHKIHPVTIYLTKTFMCIAYPVLVRTDSLFCCVSSYSHKNLCVPRAPSLAPRSRAYHKVHKHYSWVIWSTSVTVESKGRFFSGFVFYEG